MTDERQVSSPGDFRNATTKIVKLPTLEDDEGKAMSVRIRKLSQLDIIKTGQLFFDVTYLELVSNPERAAAKISKAIDNMKGPEMGELYREIICEGVIEPVVVNKPDHELDREKEISVVVFSDDTFWLGDQIFEFSDMGGEMAEKAKGFSDESGGDGDDTSPGEELRAPTDSGDEGSDTGGIVVESSDHVEGASVRGGD